MAEGEGEVVGEDGAVGEGEGGVEGEVVARGKVFGDGEFEEVGAGGFVPVFAVGFGGGDGEGPGGEEGGLFDECRCVEESKGDFADALGGVVELVEEFEAGLEDRAGGLGGGGGGSGGSGGEGDAGERMETDLDGGEDIHAGVGERGF